MDEVDESAHIFIGLTAPWGETLSVVRQLHARAVQVVRPLLADAPDAHAILWNDVNHVVLVSLKMLDNTSATAQERAAALVLRLSTEWIANAKFRQPINAFKLAHNWALMSETLRIGNDTRDNRKKFATRPRDSTIPARNARFRGLALEKYKANPALGNSVTRLAELIRIESGAKLSKKEIAKIISPVIPKRPRLTKVAD